MILRLLEKAVEYGVFSVSGKETRIRGILDKEKELSINVRELKSILFALQLHASSAANSTINLYTDNVTALKYVKKIRRNQLNLSTRLGISDSRAHQPVQPQDSLSVHTGCDQHSSRSIKQTHSTFIRMNITNKMVSTDSKQMEPMHHRRLCSPSQQPIAEILKLTSRSSSNSSGHISAALAKEEPLPSPSLEINSKSTHIFKRQKVQEVILVTPY